MSIAVRIVEKSPNFSSSKPVRLLFLNANDVKAKRWLVSFPECA
jgi:hypothetical protein